MPHRLRRRLPVRLAVTAALRPPSSRVPRNVRVA